MVILLLFAGAIQVEAGISDSYKDFVLKENQGEEVADWVNANYPKADCIFYPNVHSSNFVFFYGKPVYFANQSQKWPFIYWKNGFVETPENMKEEQLIRKCETLASKNSQVLVICPGDVYLSSEKFKLIYHHKEKLSIPYGLLFKVYKFDNISLSLNTSLSYRLLRKE